jgi:ribosomal protein S27E
MPTYDIANVTCRTGGCSNANITLSVYRRSGGVVLCGVCGNQITEIAKTGQIDLAE